MTTQTSAPAVVAKPRVGIVKFASCDGCQLSILDLESELLEVVARFDIVEFPEASSNRSDGPYDVLLVEGSISTAEQADQILELRKQSKLLVTIGACATSGGIQALRNWADHDAFRASIYAHPEYVDSLAMATPVADHVEVDAELRGCPIGLGQLRELLTALVLGRRPEVRDESVCAECKRRGAVCILVASGQPCLGPVTQGGCGALCPRWGRGCYGCFGPREGANAASLSRTLIATGLDEPEVGRLFAGFTAWAEPFRSIVSDLGGTRGTRAAPDIGAGGVPMPGAGTPETAATAGAETDEATEGRA
jgi:coenzyme F420-reducing hydrogenase gamma subunit